MSNNLVCMYKLADALGVPITVDEGMEVGGEDVSIPMPLGELILQIEARFVGGYVDAKNNVGAILYRVGKALYVYVRSVADTNEVMKSKLYVTLANADKVDEVVVASMLPKMAEEGRETKGDMDEFEADVLAHGIVDKWVGELVSHRVSAGVAGTKVQWRRIK